jgi:broad specificity phosphatase PhoE
VTIFLVRHGETLWNLERRFQGRFDSPLSEGGLAQARAISRLLASLPQAASAPIVASPQGRARRTAEIIREQLGGAGELRFDDRLRELSLGSWDGLTYTEIGARSPGIFDGDGRHEWYFRSPDGESYEAFAGRLAEWQGELDRSRPLIVVAHGLVSRMLRGFCAGLSRQAALSLPVPQDRVFRLGDGVVDELAAPVLGADERG